MKRPEPDSPGADARSRAAAEWLVRRDRGLTAAEQDEFLQWLAADPRHGEWFALHRCTVGDFSALAQWRPEHSEEPNPDLLAPPQRPMRWFVPLVLAAAAAVALVLQWRPAVPASPVATPAPANELERRILEDGSSVELNRGAQVTVDFNDRERRVTLVRGEALFTVAKNPLRPFIVTAGGVAVRAVGTAFAVRLDSTAVEVLVTEGQVAVSGGQADHPVVPAPLVVAGERAVVPRAQPGSTQILAVTPAETARLLSWQPQLLDFSSAPLASALAEFNRRNRVQFVLADPELAAMPVIASIRSDNVEGFARFLAASPGVQLERAGDNEIVVRRKR